MNRSPSPHRTDRVLALLLCLVTIGAVPTLAATCGLVDGVVDGSTDHDSDSDGIPNCVDDLPLVTGTTVSNPGACVYVVDTETDGSDGECATDCSLRDAVSLSQHDMHDSSPGRDLCTHPRQLADGRSERRCR